MYLSKLFKLHIDIHNICFRFLLKYDLLQLLKNIAFSYTTLAGQNLYNAFSHKRHYSVSVNGAIYYLHLSISYN